MGSPRWAGIELEVSNMSNDDDDDNDQRKSRGDIRHDFAISAPAVSGLPSGTYQDTVTITVAAR